MFLVWKIANKILICLFKMKLQHKMTVMVAFRWVSDGAVHYTMLTEWVDWNDNLEEISNKVLISGSCSYII